MRTTTTERFGNRHKFTVTARRSSVDQHNLSYIKTNGPTTTSKQNDFQPSNRSSPISNADPPQTPHGKTFDFQ